MGYVVGPRTWDLDVGDKYPGVKVAVRGLTVGEALDFAPFLDGLAIAPVMDEETVKKRDVAYTLFASRVVEWNLEAKAGQPLPATLAGMQTLDWRMAKDLIHAWVTEVSEVSGPLERQSSGGSLSLVESIPMEDPSSNPGN